MIISSYKGIPVVVLLGQVRPVGSIAFLPLAVNCPAPSGCAYDFCVDSPSQGGGKLTPLLTTKPLTLCAKVYAHPPLRWDTCLRCLQCLRCLRWDTCDSGAWLRVPQTLLPHKGPSTPNPAPCHYISHGPKSTVMSTALWSGGGVRSPIDDQFMNGSQEASYAPISQNCSFSSGRFMPRWSVYMRDCLFKMPWTWQYCRGIASRAGLPGASA